jgi:hypothetical protein
METTMTGGRPAAPDALRNLFQHPRFLRDLLAAWSGVSWTHWLDLSRLSGLDRRGRPAILGRPPAFWKAPWSGDSDELWLLVEARCEEDPGIGFRLARRCLHLWERLLARAAPETKAPPRLPLVVPIVLYAGPEPWRGPRQAIDHFWPILPGLQAFAPRVPFLLFDLRRDPLSDSVQAGNLVLLLRELLASGSPRAVDAVLARLFAELDRAADDNLRRALSRYLGESFLPQRFPRLFRPEEGVWGPLPAGFSGVSGASGLGGG